MEPCGSSHTATKTVVVEVPFKFCISLAAHKFSHFNIAVDTVFFVSLNTKKVLEELIL